MGSLTKALIGKEDCSIQTNANATETFSRLNSVGSTITMTKFPDIWDGTGKIDVGEVSSPHYASHWGMSTSKSASDNADAFTAMFEGITAGTYIIIPPGTYDVAGNLTINKACTIFAYGATFSWASDTTASRGLLVTASNVEIHGLTLDGPQYAVSVGTQMGIYAYGADSSNYISGIKVVDCTITDWGFYGVHLEFVSDFVVERNTITNIYYGAILGLSAIRGTVKSNNINNVVATGGHGYGIEMSRAEADSLVTNPRSADILIEGNIVRNVSAWKGIGTHAGQAIVVSNNDVYGCLIGIGIGGCNNASAVQTFAPLDCVVTGNRVNSTGLTAGAASYGIFFTGAIDGTTPVQRATGVVSNNIVIDYGDEDGTYGCAMYFHTSQGLNISGNTLIRPGRMGVFMNIENRDFNFVGNTILDPWSSAAVVLGITCYDDYNTGYIGGNVFAVHDYTGGVKTYELDLASGIAIRVNNETGVAVTVGPNYSEAGIYVSDLGSPSSKTMRGLTVAQTSGTGEDDLCSQVFGANQFAIGDRLRVIAAGTKLNGGGADVKTLKFYFGSTAITFHAAANNENDWRFEAEIYATSATAQRITWLGWDGATPLQGYDTAAETLTTGFTMKFTGECAGALDIIYQRMFFVEKF